MWHTRWTTVRRRRVPVKMVLFKYYKFVAAVRAIGHDVVNVFILYLVRRIGQACIKANIIVALIECDLGTMMEIAAQNAATERLSFEQFSAVESLLSLPTDVSEDLEYELWPMTRVNKRDGCSLGYLTAFDTACTSIPSPVDYT